MRGRTPFLLAIAFVAATMTIALWLYPFDSDAAFAVLDAIWYAEQAERDAAASINPHHPLFHVLVIVLVRPLQALGIAHAGHVAIRMVAGVGGAWLLVQICAITGHRRILVGAAFALLLWCTRGFLVEVATGENVLPAAAAALYALTQAARQEPRLLATAAALTVALLMRQDNVFLAPGVAWAFASGLPSGSRLRGVMMLGAAVACATGIGYGLTWMVSARPDETFGLWLFRLGLDGSWTGPATLELGRFGAYAFSVALMMTGRVAPPSQDQPLFGLLYLGAILVPASMLRGTNPHLRLGAPVLLTLAGRACFHTWFEADNFEWLVLPVALVVAYSAGLCRGAPATSLLWQRTGIALLLAVVAWILISHGADTWRLRDRRLMTYVQQAATVDHTKWRFLAWGSREATALFLLGVRPNDGMGPLEGTYTDIAPNSPSEGFDRVADELARHPIPAVVLVDRFVLDGMPYTRRAGARPTFVDGPDSRLPGDVLRAEGLVYAIRWVPGDPTSPLDPASRR